MLVGIDKVLLAALDGFAALSGRILASNARVGTSRYSRGGISFLIGNSKLSLPGACLSWLVECSLLFKASEGSTPFLLRQATVVFESFGLILSTRAFDFVFYQSRHLDAKIVVPAMYLVIKL